MVGINVFAYLLWEVLLGRVQTALVQKLDPCSPQSFQQLEILSCLIGIRSLVYHSSSFKVFALVSLPVIVITEHCDVFEFPVQLRRDQLPPEIFAVVRIKYPADSCFVPVPASTKDTDDFYSLSDINI